MRDTKASLIRQLAEARALAAAEIASTSKLLAANLYAVARASKLELEAAALREQVRSMSLRLDAAKGGAR